MWLYGNLPYKAICSKGLLTQILTDHMKHGGQDPRYMVRQQLLDAGVPIHSRQHVKTGNYRAAGFVMYKKDEESKRTSEHLGKEAYHDFLRDLGLKWKLMNEADKQSWEDRAVKHSTDQQVFANEEIDKVPRDRGIHRTVNSELGDTSTPFKLSAFEAIVQHELGLEEDAEMPGFVRTVAPTLREAQIQGIFQADDGSS